MPAPSDSLPQDLAAAHAMILAQRAMLAEARSEAKVRALEIERLKLMIAKARREKFGQSSERGKQLIEQLELAISDLEETQAEEETKAEIAAPAAAKEKRARVETFLKFEESEQSRIFDNAEFGYSKVTVER